MLGTEEHPDVAASLHELAGVLQAQGDLVGARARLEKVLEIEQKVYGTRENYSSAISEMNLGFLLLNLGDMKAGLELLKHAYGVFQRQLGAEHSLTQQMAAFFASRAPEGGKAE